MSLIEFSGGFTVLMSLYINDTPELFIRAVKSIYDNSLLPNETILIVDGPISPLLQQAVDEMVKSYQIKVFYLYKNQGLAHALNMGLKHVHTEWVVRADADDYNLPHRFARLAEIISQYQQLDIVGSDILEFEDDGDALASRSLPVEHEEICQFMLKRNPFNHMAVAYKLFTVLRCGGYPNIYLREDYALWLTMIASGAIGRNVSEMLVHANAGRNMYIRRGGLRYAFAEIKLQQLMVALKLKSTTQAILHGIMRASIFAAPNWLRKLVYEKLLRKNAKSL